MVVIGASFIRVEVVITTALYEGLCKQPDISFNLAPNLVDYLSRQVVDFDTK